MEEEAISELMHLKSELEQHIGSLKAEKKDLMNKMDAMKMISDEVAEDILLETQNFQKLRVELVWNTKEQEAMRSYILNSTDPFGKETDHMTMEEFQLATFKLQSQFEEIINLYSDESLSLELLKRTNIVRDLRTEYTRIEASISDLQRKIEKRRAEKEAERQAALLKAQAEEELMRKNESERLQVERAKLREKVRYHGFERRFPGIPEESEKHQPFPDEPELNGSSLSAKSKFEAGHQINCQSEVPSLERANQGEVTFSQLLRW